MYHDGINLRQLKRLIWEAAGGQFNPDGSYIDSWHSVYIFYAKCKLRWDCNNWNDGSMYQYAELLKEVKRIRESKITSIAQDFANMNKPPVVIESDHIKLGTNTYDAKSMRQRYTEANKEYTEREFPEWFKAGHWFAPKYPNCATANGITDLVTNYLKWMGHFANRTNNMGTARKHTIPRFNIHSGKVEQLDAGIRFTKSHSQKGMQDIDANLTHAKHQFGIPWKIEVKAGRDKISEHQVAYGARVKKTGAVYSVVRDDEDFFSQYDGLMES